MTVDANDDGDDDDRQICQDIHWWLVVQEVRDGLKSLNN